MASVTVEEAQAHLPELIDRLRTGDEVVITRDSRPVARLTSPPVPSESPRQLGTLRGTVLHMAPDFDAPLDDFWEYAGVKLLVDSHTVIWAVDDPSRLTAVAAAALQDPANELIVSAGTVWEIAIKVGLGKLVLGLPYRQWMTRAMADLGLVLLPITVEYADAQAALPRHHGDPFDRLLVAQALTEGVSIVSADVAFDPYGVMRVW